MTTTVKESVVKVAVTRAGHPPQLVELHQTKPLAAFISTLCDGWRLSDPENYALKYRDSKDIINERNRHTIQKGEILELFDSPVKAAENVLAGLSGEGADKLAHAIELLDINAEIYEFAAHFVNSDGIPLLVRLVQANVCSGKQLGIILSAVCDLMSHGLSSWEIFEDSFIKQINVNIAKPSGVDVNVLQSSLEILEMIILADTSNHTLVLKLVSPVTLLTHLSNADSKVQENTIGFINALFRRADKDLRKEFTENLQQKSFRNTIMSQIIVGKNPSEEMRSRLSTLQGLLFNALEEQRNTPVNVNDQGAVKKLEKIRQAAFDPDGETTNNARRRSQQSDYKKLGFENTHDPLQDFTRTPPGSLALKAMTYYAEHGADEFAKIVLENSSRADSHDLPLAKGCIDLTELLCDILQVGQQPGEEEGHFCPMFFTTEYPFEELFCVCVGLLNKTWKEMRATLADFSKVMSVVREQINRALSERHNSYEQFKVKLGTLTYAHITTIWQNERRDKEEWTSQVKPIIDLRKKVMPEIENLIKQQRLNFLVAGSRFKLPGRKDTKFWYCKLTQNHKALVYYECDENNKKIPEDAIEKNLHVEEFKHVLSGKDCPHVKETKKGTKQATTHLAFSILTGQGVDALPGMDLKDPPSLNFIAVNLADVEKWVDGLNCLLQKPMTSKLKEEEMDMLLQMEIKLRLLDTEGITIPEKPPAIPEEPPNYDFHYKT